MADVVLSFFILTFLEIILGIDNIVFISLAVSGLRKNLQRKARILGVLLGVVFRCIFLFFFVLIVQASKPLFSIYTLTFSTKDLILISGGVFLVVKGIISITQEISVKKEKNITIKEAGVFGVMMQIAVIDFVFSFDSLVAAIGITHNMYVIVAAILISVVFMLYFSGIIVKIIKKYTGLKMLALFFVLMIGVVLILNGFKIDFDKNYVYFAMLFCLLVEVFHILSKKRKQKVAK